MLPISQPLRERAPATVDPAGGWVWQRFDPVVIAVGAVAVVTYWLHGFGGKFVRDVGVYAYGARQVLAGDPPYVGIVNRAGPLAHMLPAPGIVAARVAGVDELLVMRLGYMTLAVACVVLAYLIVRGIFSSRAAGLAAAATLLGFEGFIALATNGPREKTPMVLFILLAIWALSRQRWLLTGVCISLATLTLQISFFPLLAGAVVAVVVLAGRRRLRALVLVGVGGAIPAAAVVAYFAVFGAVRDLLDGFVVLNARYSSGRSILAWLDVVWPRMLDGFGLSLWLLLGGLVALVAVAVMRVIDGTRRREPATAALASLVAALVVALLWTLVDFDNWPDAFPFLPLAAIGIGAGVAELGHRVPRTAGHVIGAVAILLPTVLAVQFSVTDEDHAIARQRAATRSVLRHVPDARIWSIEAPQFLVLAKQENPTRHQLFSEGLEDHLEDTWPGGLDAFVEWNLARQPDLIAVGRDELHDGGWEHRIGPDYVVVAQAPAVAWFAHRSVGEDAITAIRKADRRSRGASAE